MDWGGGQEVPQPGGLRIFRKIEVFDPGMDRISAGPIFRKMIFRDFMAILLFSQVAPVGPPFGQTWQAAQRGQETRHPNSEL